MIGDRDIEIEMLRLERAIADRDYAKLKEMEEVYGQLARRTVRKTWDGPQPVRDGILQVWGEMYERAREERLVIGSPKTEREARY